MTRHKGEWEWVRGAGEGNWHFLTESEKNLGEDKCEVIEPDESLLSWMTEYDK